MSSELSWKSMCQNATNSHDVSALDRCSSTGAVSRGYVVEGQRPVLQIGNGSFCRSARRKFRTGALRIFCDSNGASSQIMPMVTISESR